MACASMNYCDVCNERDKTSIATKFCSDCEDKLCSECLDVHNALKSCRNHHVVDVTVSNNQYLTVNKNCEKHADLPFELYCCDHDVICCRSCMADDHRACGKLTPIEVAAKNIKSSNMFEEISKQANQLNETSRLLIDTVQKSKILLDKSKVASIDKVSGIKENLHRRIDELANECVSEINNLYSELSERVDMDEQEVEKRVNIIKDTLTKFDFVSQHGSDKQIFLHLNSIKTDIYKIDASLDEFVPTLKTASVEFEISNTTAMLSSIGSTKTSQGPGYFKYKPIKQQQAQFNTRSCPAPTNFELEKKVIFSCEKSAVITGMCATKDSRMILCNWAGVMNELLVLTDQGQFTQIIKLIGRPWNIAMEPGTADAWVTLPGSSYLQVIDTKSLSSKRQVKVSGRFYGITFVDSRIALGTTGKVDIIDRQGVCLKSFKVGSGRILYSLSYTGQNQLYCCEADSDQFHCLSMDNINLFSYTCIDFKGPMCVNADHHGNVYVLCYRSNNLHKLTADGKLLDVVLHKKDGLNDSYAACFNENCSKLFTVNKSTKEVFIFATK